MFVGSFLIGMEYEYIYLYIYGVYLYVWVHLPPVQKNYYKTIEGKILQCCLTWNNNN